MGPWDNQDYGPMQPSSHDVINMCIILVFSLKKLSGAWNFCIPQSFDREFLTVVKGTEDF